MKHAGSTSISFRRRLAADLALFAVVFVWGVTFVAVKAALPSIGVFSFLAVRFSLAFVFLAVVFCRRLARIDGATAKASAIIGLFLFAGYAFQTAGLQYTSAASAGFVTGLSVVLVPCFAAVLTRRPPGPAATAGAGLAAIGLALLTLNGNTAFNYGDVLVLGCAVAFALHILAIGHFAPRLDANLLATLQIGVTALLCAFIAAASEPLPAHFTEAVWLALAVTAIPATALAFLVQTTAQKFTTPSRTAIILALEPVFAAAAGIYFLGETLTIWQLAGCGLMLAGTLVSELLPDRWEWHT